MWTFTLHPLQLTKMFITLLWAKNCPELSHINIKYVYKDGTTCRQPSVYLSVVVIEIWASIYSIGGIQINITMAMYNLHVVEITDLNLNVQTKQEKSEQKLNLQATNKLAVFYSSLYFKFTNFVWFTCTNPLQDYLSKRYSTLYKTCWLTGLFLSWQKDNLE